MLGDVLKVLPGGKVPTDGEMLWGEGQIDESMLTGEPLPVHKSAGDRFIGAAVNTAGVFHMRATRVGANTALSQIVRLMSDAQTATALPASLPTQ